MPTLTAITCEFVGQAMKNLQLLQSKYTSPTDMLWCILICKQLGYIIKTLVDVITRYIAIHSN